MVGVTKPDGSVTTTVYDNKQRVTSTVERTANGAVITGFEYTYDALSRIVEEKHLDNNTKMCYTYDSLNRVTVRTVKKLSDNSVVSTETFSYDAAGNVTDAPDSCFAYDTNNRLVVFNGNNVNYDLDGNMLNNGVKSFTYDSANRLITADGHTYTYNAEGVRIRNLCAEEDTTYTYDTNCRLSKLLCKTTNGVTTKYVYGRGLIGEEVSNTFKTYHFDCRGSTIAITDASGNITDTFAYDTYGKLLSRTGTSTVIFCYNGKDGVVTDSNGLVYMRARYYAPDMKRFVNADIVAGQISNAVTLNRFAYANGNPVSFVDPFGLWSLKEGWKSVKAWGKRTFVDPVVETYHEVKDGVVDTYNIAKDAVVDTYNTAKDAVVDTYNNAKDFVVDTYNDAKDAVVETYNEVIDWTVDTYNDVKERAVDTYNNVKDWVEDAKVAIKDFGEKAGNAFLNSIEVEAGVGYGFGKSFKAGCFEIEAQAYSDNFTVRLDDNELFMDNSGSAGLSANILDQNKISFGVSGSYHHDYGDRPNDCKEHHAWSNPFSVATCEHADKTPMSFSVPIKGAIGADVSEDVVLGFSGATHIGVGYHYSVGVNISQFWRELLA